MELARERILAIGFPPEAHVGETYEGEVVNITKFGAFVNILPGRDGLLHISKMGGGKRIDRVEDVLALGDKVNVLVREIDDRGKVSLDLADGVQLVDENTPTSSGGGERSERSDRGGDRGGDRNRDRGDRGGRDRGGRDRGRGGRDRGRSEKREERSDTPNRTVVSFEDEFEKGL